MAEDISRRSFLAATGTTVASFAAGMGDDKTPAQPPPGVKKRPGVRVSVTDLNDNSDVLKWYRQAVAKMKSLPPTDARSWTFQANLHGVPPADGDNPAWKWCQHGNWWFLPWHRGYLYYFERIVRSFSDDRFRLPYWPWEQPGQDILPPAFRNAFTRADPNPLYEAARFDHVNAGKPIREGHQPGTFAVDWRNALRQSTAFTSSRPERSFGGLKVPVVNAPTHPDGLAHGAMESLAHDVVHVCVAPRDPTGKAGLMGSPQVAARDPIFWLHHANVDRLWNRWLDGRDHDNPQDTDWLKQVFPFFDENGKPVSKSVEELLALAADDYRYNDDRVFGFARSNPPVVQGKPVQLVETTVGSAAPMLALGVEAFVKPIGLQQAAKPKLVAALGPPPATSPSPTVVLQVENIEPPADANVMYEVFLTKKGDQAERKYYLGPISFFGRGDGHGHGAKEKGFTQAFDATDVLQQIQHDNKGELPELEVRIVPRSTDLGESKEKFAARKISIPITNVTLKVIDEKGM